MKITYRIPTEQYSYVEINSEEVAISADGIVANYKHYSNAFKSQEGVADKEMNTVIDTMLLGESVENGTEIYQKMSDQQKEVCQTIKRALKRIEAKNK